MSLYSLSGEIFNDLNEFQVQVSGMKSEHLAFKQWPNKFSLAAWQQFLHVRVLAIQCVTRNFMTVIRQKFCVSSSTKVLNLASYKIERHLKNVSRHFINWMPIKSNASGDFSWLFLGYFLLLKDEIKTFILWMYKEKWTANVLTYDYEKMQIDMELVNAQRHVLLPFRWWDYFHYVMGFS